MRPPTSLRPNISASALAVAGVAAVASALGAIGADALWLVALGGEIASDWSVPEGVPFAAAPSRDWPNVLVLAELAFHALHSLGDRGLLLAVFAAVAAAFGVLAVDSRRAGATDASTALVLLIVVLGAFPSIAIVRLQLFSLALFPVLLLLLRSETRHPSRRVWLLVPLFALWGNLHGAVLVGLAVAGAYLAVERGRAEPLVAVGVATASVASLFANPALERTFDYYRGVLGNEAAARGVGLWEPVDVRSALGLLLVATTGVLLVLAVRARPRLWELVAIAGLTLLTIRTARSGVWLAFAAVAPAARALPFARAIRPRVALAAAASLIVLVLVGIARGPIETGASQETLDRALRTAGGRPILAEPALAEQVVAAGGRIWLGNPLDAFSRSDQRLYLDWLDGRPSGDRALDRVQLVLVRVGSDSERRLRATNVAKAVGSDGNAVLYRLSATGG